MIKALGHHPQWWRKRYFCSHQVVCKPATETGGNEIVTYELKTDDRGRTQAVSVAFDGEGVRSTSSVRRNVCLFLAFTFIGFVAGSVFAGKLPPAVLWSYCVASPVAFVAYALDKSAAKNNRWRISESTLHFIALIGGWPGALAAQRLLFHKSKKQSFQIVFWATVVFNCGALIWLLSPLGAEELYSILYTMAGLIHYYANKLHFWASVISNNLFFLFFRHGIIMHLH